MQKTHRIFLRYFLRATALSLGTCIALFLLTSASDWCALLTSDVNRADPVLSREVLSYELRDDGTVEYEYAAEPLPEKIVPDEVPALRNESSYTRKVFTTAEGVDVFELKAYSGKAYAKTNGVWVARGRATTDRATFAMRRQSNFLASLFWERTYAASTVMFSSVGDGYINHGGTVWSTVVNDAVGTSIDYTGTAAIVRSETLSGGALVGINRVFLPFDTSAIPSSATVSAATLSVGPLSRSDLDDDGNDFITVVRSSQASHTSLTTADYNDVGSTEGISSSERKDISRIATDAGGAQRLQFILNSTGLGWIARAGMASNCSSTAGITCLALREGHDILVDQPAAATDGNSITLDTSEVGGTSRDPSLTVTYYLNTIGTVVVVLTSGTSWTVPSNWNNTSNTIEVVGGGGAGGNGGAGDSSNAGSGGGGGGGGGYSRISNVTLTPNTSVDIQIGQGGATAAANGTDTFFDDLNDSGTVCDSNPSTGQRVCAKGGTGGTSGVNNGTPGTNGTGGTSGSGVGTTVSSGGNGGSGGTFTSGNDAGSGGGGGGGAGGSTASGSTGNNGVSSAATTPGGAGGAGGAGGSASGGTAGTSGAGGTQSSTGGREGGAGGVGTLWGAIGAGGGGGGGGANARDSIDSAGYGGFAGAYGGGGGGGGGGARGSAPATTQGSTAAGYQGIIVISYNIARAVLSKPSNNLGLVGYWSFNEGTSTIATDFSGNGKHGTFSGNAVTWVSGKRGSAVDLGGTDDNVNVGMFTNLDGIQKMTISAWIYDTAGTAAQSLVSRFGLALDGPSFYFGTSDASRGGGNDIEFGPAGTEGGYTTGNVHQPNRWEHWVMVFDGSQANANRVTLYLNGVSQTTTTSGTINGNIDSAANVVRIGADADEEADFTGRLDEVRIYNRALSASEAAALYGSGAIKLAANSKDLTVGSTLSNGLIGLWSMDGGDVLWGTNPILTAYDRSGNNYYVTSSALAPSTAPAIGRLGQALNFDGVDDWLSCIDSLCDGLDMGTSNWTAAVWVKPTSLTNAGYIVGKANFYGGGNPDAWAIEMTGSTGRIRGSIRDNAAEVFSTADGSALTVGDWYHVVVVWDRSGNMTRYINGVQTGTADSISAISGNVNNPNEFRIGGRDATSDELPFAGLIDDVRVYNRILSATEIKQLYNLGQSKITP